MAFRQLKKGSWQRQERTAPCVAVYGKNAVFTIPSKLLHDAGLSSGSQQMVTILVGEDDDRGRVAITNGNDFKLVTGGRGLVRVSTSQIASAKSFKVTDCAFAVQGGALILTLPLTFPWRSNAEADVPALASLGRKAPSALSTAA